MKILAFGIAKDIIGGSTMELGVPDNIAVGDLKRQLVADFPRFGELTAFAIAVNNEYADQQQLIKAGDEVVIIPPVSGG